MSIYVCIYDDGDFCVAGEASRRVCVCMLVTTTTTTTTTTEMTVGMLTMIAIFMSLGREHHVVVWVSTVQWQQLDSRDCASRFCMLLLRNGASCDMIGTDTDVF